MFQDSLIIRRPPDLHANLLLLEFCRINTQAFPIQMWVLTDKSPLFDVPHSRTRIIF